MKETKICPEEPKNKKSKDDLFAPHPYQEYEQTKLWKSIDKAISELVKNGDLSEQTRREYIVGFLVKSLRDSIA